MLNFIIYLLEELSNWQSILQNNYEIKSIELSDNKYIIKAIQLANLTVLGDNTNININDTLYYSNKKHAKILKLYNQKNLEKYLYKYNTTKCYMFNIFKQKFELIDINNENDSLIDVLDEYINDKYKNKFKKLTVDIALQTLFKTLLDSNIQNNIKLIYNHNIYTRFIIMNTVLRLIYQYYERNTEYLYNKKIIKENLYKQSVLNILQNNNIKFYLNYFVPEYYENILFDTLNQDFYIRTAILINIHINSDIYNKIEKKLPIIHKIFSDIVHNYNTNYNTNKPIMIANNYKILKDEFDSSFTYIDTYKNNIYIHINYLHEFISYLLYDYIIDSI